MNSKVDIQGDVGIALNAEKESNVYITVNQASAIEARVSPEIMRSVHVLLKTCEKNSLRPSLEAIAQLIFGSDHFKSLSVDDLSKLQLIAEEFNDKLNRMQSDFDAKYDNRDEVDFNQFYKETGMRASTPERAALRLLFKENVTPRATKFVWNELLLNYEDDNQLVLKVPAWRAWAGWALVAFSIVLCCLGAFSGTIIGNAYHNLEPIKLGTRTIAFLLITVIPGLYTFYLAGTFLRPYLIAKRIKPYVDKVNLKLKQKNQ